MKDKPRKAPVDSPKDVDRVFCTEYKHAKTGKLMRAADYGHKSWCFLVRNRRS